MDESQADKISQFTGVTGVDADRAKFYLESAAWSVDGSRPCVETQFQGSPPFLCRISVTANLPWWVGRGRGPRPLASGTGVSSAIGFLNEVAIASFYEDDDGTSVDVGSGSAASVNPSAAPGRPPKDSGGQARSQGSSRFGTIGGLSSPPDDEDSSDEGEAYYAGGSERGAGQQILGPPKKRGDKFVQKMFDAAKEHGAEAVEPGSSSGGAGGGGGSSAFRGMGFRLGETDSEPSQSVMGLPRQGQQKDVPMTLKMWKTGFSVDDGPLREYHAEENKEFLNSIRQGQVPKELTRLAKGGTVDLNMEDHRDEEYVKPKVTMKAFSGEGHKLGSPTPAVVSTGSSTSAQASAQATAQSSVNVDKSKPTTNLQIRLSDGTRMVATFNLTHTIADVRTYITTAHPQFSAVNFVLMTTFPNKELTDETETLEAAKLLNAVLVQRLK